MMRGLLTPIREYRRNVFKEVALVAYNSNADNLKEMIEQIPYKIVTEDIQNYSTNQYRKRAIASERVRLAIGMSLRPEDEPVPLTSGIEESNISDKYYEPPLMQVIPSACTGCEENKFEVSNMCKGCTAHPCCQVCPVDAVYMEDGRSNIDQDKCIKCGKCKKACPYDAIAKKERPCAKSCGVDAIKSDKFGRAKINIDKCVSCGMCMVNCPFGAIADKSQIFQLIRALKENYEIVCEIAPAFVGQFGDNISIENLKAGLLELGFSEVYEVAKGADIGAVQEAHHYVEKVVHNQLPFLLTSCCPSWAMLAKKQFPDLIDEISQELTPMVSTARLIKEERPNAKVVFIGPCPAKKLEAMRKTVKSDVDFVITFEELQGIFDAKEINLLKDAKNMADTTVSSQGRGYAQSGGVANAISRCVHQYYDNIDVKVKYADGLFECKKILSLAKANKLDGYLIEGMGCPGGCIAGAGTNIKVESAIKLLNKFVDESEQKMPINH